MKYCNKAKQNNEFDNITVEQLEQMRKQIITKLHNCRIILGIIITLFIISTLLYIFLATKNVNVTLFVYITLIIIAIGTITYKIIYSISIRNESKYAKYYKTLITKKVFETDFPSFSNFMYMPEKGIPKRSIAMTDLIELGNIFEGRDYIKATYNNIPFEYSDILIEYRGNKDATEKHAIHFQGQWFILNLSKTVESNIRIFNIYSTAFTKKSILGKYCLVELENIEFNKKMKVYSENSSEVFYILTPQMIEKITQLENQFNNELLFCFTENKLHIAFNSGTDSLEPSLNVPLDEKNLQKVISQIKQEMQIIIDIINILQQNNNYFRKEES